MTNRHWLLICLGIFMWSIAGVVSAQGGMMTYGETRSETLSTTNPQILYTLAGNENDIVTIYALGWVETFQPSITVLGPSGQLGFSTRDALTPIDNDARVTIRLPQSGNYSILVGSATGTLDTFTVAVRLTSNATAGEFLPPVTLEIPEGGESFTYQINASENNDTPLLITSNTADFAFAAAVSAGDGRIVAAFDGVLPSVSLNLPPSSDTYTLVIRASNPEDTGTLTLSQFGTFAVETTESVTVEEATTVPTDVPTLAPPTATVDIVTNNDIPQDECVAVAGSGGSNIRTGAGVNFEVLRILAPFDFMYVTGQSNGWYTDGMGWVAGDVVSLQGPCAEFGIVDYNAPRATATPMATATATTVAVEATPTPTEETATVEPTATEVSAQIATIDAEQYNFVVNRDTGGTLINDVSYPDGDTSDRIRVTIDGLTNQPPNNFREMTILVTCFGEGTENFSWGTGGPNSPTNKGCNESLTVSHTNDSNQTYINTLMTGDGYINYSVVVTINP